MPALGRDTPLDLKTSYFATCFFIDCLILDQWIVFLVISEIFITIVILHYLFFFNMHWLYLLCEDISIQKRKEIIIFSPLKILLLSRYKHGKNKGKLWGNKMTQNYLRDNNNLSCICNNLVLSREELFYGFAFTM